MIERIAQIGRLKTVAVISTIAAAASIAVTTLSVALLNASGAGINLTLAVVFAAFVPLLVAPPITSFLVTLLFRLRAAEEKMRNLASYDSLTGLLSRHAFFDSARNYVSLAHREGRIFSLLIIDLDYFKSINDQYGHPAGDAVLKLFADVVNSVARRSDIVGRLGGEEFAIILPSTGAREALEFANRLHEAIETAVLKYKDHIIEYTASIGLTSSEPGSGEKIDALLARADLALYQAKRDGRNQTAIFKDEIERVASA